MSTNKITLAEFDKLVAYAERAAIRLTGPAIESYENLIAELCIRYNLTRADVIAIVRSGPF